MKSQQILIADDDPKVLSLLTSSLKKAGYDTFEALDGEAAQEIIEQENPDLILADITMPKVDGFELCKRVRENPITANIPFMFLTAKGELNDRVKGLNLGADDYIAKPFHIAEVTARIKAILQRSVPSAAAPKTEPESDLKGNLEQMGLPEIMQTLGMAHKTGGLKLVNGPKVGKLYFENGNIVQATLGKYKDEEAVYRILSWEEGAFNFDSNDQAAETTIQTSMNSLLMEGFQQREDYAKYKKAMPAYDSVVKLASTERVKEMKAASRKVVELIDGARTIQDVIDESPINYLLSVKILYTLLKKEIITAVEDWHQHGRQDQDFSQLAQELYE
jgi:CheY-like chemotaxis protein